MIAYAISSLASIFPANWVNQSKVSFSAGSSLGLTSPSRRILSLRANAYKTKQDLFCGFGASSSQIFGRGLVHPLTTKFETISESDARTQLFNTTNVLDSNTSIFFKDVNNLVPVALYRPTSIKEKNPKKLSSNSSQIKKLDHLLVIRYPIVTESAIKAILECNTLVFAVDKHADKNDIRDAVKKVFKIRAKKVNSSIMPNGTKKAYVMLAPDCNAMDVAKKFNIL